MLSDELENLRGIDGPQAHLQSTGCRHRPRHAPAVAVKERTRPEEDGLLREPEGADLAAGVEIGAAVRVHHAFRRARRAGRVVDRQERILVLDGVAYGQHLGAVDEALVALLSFARRDPLIGDLDDTLQRSDLVAQRIDLRRQLRIHQQQPGAGVIEDLADLGTEQAGVDRHEGRADERRREVRGDVPGRVRRQDGHAVSGPDAGAPQGARHAACLARQVAVVPEKIAVSDGGSTRKDAQAALEQDDGRQRVLEHIAVGQAAHGGAPRRACCGRRCPRHRSGGGRVPEIGR